MRPEHGVLPLAPDVEDNCEGDRAVDGSNTGSNPLSFVAGRACDEYHADELFKRLSGRLIAEAEMERFVLTQTPFYKFKKAVQLLCKQKRAEKIQGAAWRVRFS